MPLNKIQEQLKKMMPEKMYGKLYGVVCNTYDVYAKTMDYSSLALDYVRNAANSEESNKIEMVWTVLTHTMVSKAGVMATFDIAYKCVQNKVRGCFVECGVARGGCSALMAMIARNEYYYRKTWLFDSFEGLPKPTENDDVPVARHQSKKSNDVAEGHCLGTYKEVENWLFNDLKLSSQNVFMVKGWFQDTLPKFKSKVGNIAVLRLDSDLYESTKCCLKNLYGNVVSGGFVIIDDYHLAGCKKAVDEFMNGQSFNIKVDDKDGRAYIEKI